MTEQKIRFYLAAIIDGDVFLVRRALERRGLPHELVVSHNGEEALTWLDGHTKNTDWAPDLILLDLNLPLK